MTAENALEHKFFTQAPFPKRLPVKYIWHKPDQNFYTLYDCKAEDPEAQKLQSQAAFHAELLKFLEPKGKKTPKKSASSSNVFKTQASLRDFPLIKCRKQIKPEKSEVKLKLRRPVKIHKTQKNLTDDDKQVALIEPPQRSASQNVIEHAKLANLEADLKLSDRDSFSESGSE